MTVTRAYDLAVIGAGSAGMAAALTAGRMGLTVLLLDRAPAIGGTATLGGVNVWEVDIAGTAQICREIYRRLQADRPPSVGIYSFGRHFGWQEEWAWPDRLDQVNFPGGELLIDPDRNYSDTLRRHPDPDQRPTEAWRREHWHGVCYLPEAMIRVQEALLQETGNVTLLTSTTFTDVESQPRDGQMTGIRLSDGRLIRARLWIDATGGALAHAAGCETLIGCDSRDRFNEPAAPLTPSTSVNGVSLIYAIAPADGDTLESLPDDIPASCWWQPHFPPMQCAQYPDGRRACNMLPTMAGSEWIAMDAAAAYRECVRRVKAHWHFVQTFWPEFRGYRLNWIAPILGIREGRRVVCETMLTENDIRRGLERQSDPDMIAVADHALDRHGDQSGCPELEQPYGVPYRCLIPRGWRNLLIAGRAAGFSSVAASSCRLTRTMMRLGQAAGAGAALALNRAVDPPDVPPDDLHQTLQDQEDQEDQDSGLAKNNA